MGKIEFHQLSKADIVFTTQSDSPTSATIRAATNSIISHTMLVTDSLKIIEARDDGVREKSWDEASKGATLASAMRRHSLLSGEDQDKVVKAAKAFENRPFDYYGAAGSGMFGSKRNQIVAGAGCTLNLVGCAVVLKKIADNAKDENADKLFFCAELVSRAFSIAGFPIVDGKATNTTPHMAYTATTLSYVGHLITPPVPPASNITEEDRERYRRAGYRKDN